MVVPPLTNNTAKTSIGDNLVKINPAVAEQLRQKKKKQKNTERHLIMHCTGTVLGAVEGCCVLLKLWSPFCLSTLSIRAVAGPGSRGTIRRRCIHGNLQHRIIFRRSTTFNPVIIL